MLEHPKPERFSLCDIDRPDLAQLSLSIGVDRITRTPSGLKVIPHLAVVFDLSPDDKPGDRTFDIPAHWARSLADKLNEFANYIEQNNGETRDFIGVSGQAGTIGGDDQEVGC